MHRITAALWVGGAALPLASWADTPGADAGAHSLTYNLALTSDYRFRGLSQTGKKPAIQAGLDYAHGSGAYLGAWASNVNGNQYPGAHMEMDLYGGYKLELARELGGDFGLIHVHYPGGKSTSATTTFASRPGTTTYPNTTEVYAGMTYRWFSVKYNYSLSSSLFGLDSGTVGTLADINGNNAYNTPNKNTRGSGYLDLSANFEVADKLALNLHLGHQNVRNYSKFSYSDYKVGLTKDLAGFSISAAIYGTNARSEWWFAQTPSQVGSTSRTRIGDPGLVLSVSRTF